MENYDDYSAWDLFRRGQIDQRKHLKIIERMIKENITDLITHGKIITGHNVAIPVKHLKQWRFMYDKSSQEGTTVLPDSGKKEKGDIIGEKPQEGGEGSREGGCEGGGSGEYEVVVNADKIAEYLFENMQLPRLQKRMAKDSVKEEYKMDSVSKRGSINNLQKRRTIYQNIRRNASQGDPKFKDVIDEDLRYKAHSVKKVPQDRILSIFIRDRSASMDDFKKELTRILSFWFNQFLQYKYSTVVERRFVLFDTTGAEVPEDDFYAVSEGGGTLISSGLEVADKIIEREFPPSHYNIYIFLFTDGDNWSNDNENAIKLINKLASVSNLVGVCQVMNSNPQALFYRKLGSGDSDFIKNVKESAEITESLEVADVTEQEEILDVMKQFFGGEE